jgi:hypothetical protein
MADEIDQANAIAEADTDRAIAAARRGADIPAGEPGACDLCGEWSGRLVRGACAPCRDRYRLA